MPTICRVLHFSSVLSHRQTQQPWLWVWVKVLCPTRLKTGHFEDNLLASTEQTEPNTTKANIHPEHENITSPNKHQKLKSDLVATYDRHRNRAGPMLQLPGPTQGTTTLHANPAMTTARRHSLCRVHNAPPINHKGKKGKGFPCIAIKHRQVPNTGVRLPVRAMLLPSAAQWRMKKGQCQATSLGHNCQASFSAFDTVGWVTGGASRGSLPDKWKWSKLHVRSTSCKQKHYISNLLSTIHVLQDGNDILSFPAWENHPVT